MVWRRAQAIGLLAVSVVAYWCLLQHGAFPPGSEEPRERRGRAETGAGPELEQEATSPAHGPPEDWMLRQRAYPRGIPAGALSRAATAADRVDAETARHTPAVLAPKWTLVGPTNIGGRVLDIALDPALPNTLYVAAATGGVWKSADAGATFTPLWPSNYPQAIGAIAAASDGTLLAGTGEASAGGGSLAYGGDGVYRSTDRGKTWANTGLSTSGAIGRIAVDPKDPKRVFVAAAGSLFNPGGERGLYRSTDEGITWTRVRAGANSTTGAVDVAIDPLNPNRVYVAMWDHIRSPDLRRYSGAGSGLFRSIDGGTKWKRLGGGLPPSTTDLGRIGLAVAPSNPSRLYAVVIRSGGVLEGFYSSSNGGDSWTKLPSDVQLTRSQATYGWWFGRVWVDPADENHVFVGGVPLMESFEGGRGWREEYEPHVDHHAMVWDDNVPGRVYLGTDGGVYRSDVNGAGEWVKAKYEPYTQFYTVDVGEQDSTHLVGGTQDNGSLRSYPGAWNEYYGGDGLANLISYEDLNAVYACAQYGYCARSTDGGDTFFDFTRATISARRNWLTPLVFDPNDPSVMYYAGDRLNRSTDGGQTWQVISPDLAGGPGRDKQYPFGTITTVAAAKTSASTILVGTDDGRLWFTTNLGQGWTHAQDPDLPSYWITRVAVDPANAKVAYATYSGYRAGVDEPYVVRTSDGGATWANITGNLPPAPVNDIVVHSKMLYVGTDVGVYLTRDSGRTWLSLGLGLPRTPVTDIRLHASTRTLFAATYGRGIYRIKLQAR
ncbi:MAG: glycosyl hydrolase [Acidobacteriota bacterium]